MSTLYHYTCAHGHRRITATWGTCCTAPEATLEPNLGLVWLTDLEAPFRDALGLTSHALKCDRTQHRYRVVNANDCQPWPEWHQERSGDHLIRDLVETLESAPGAKPMHWWVSERPVPAVYDPIRSAVMA